MYAEIEAAKHPNAFKNMTDQTRKTVDEDPSGAFYMAVMDHTGDTKIMWSKDNEEEVEEAREQFNRMKKKGFAAFFVKGKDGAQGEQMHEFDPKAERIIFVKQMRGG